MANTLGSLVVRLGLDATDYVQGMSKADQQAQRFSREQQRHLKKIESIANDIGRAIGSFAVVYGGALAAMAVQTARFADEIDEMSQSSGIAAGKLQELKYAADVGGTGFETLQASLKKFNVNVAAATAGNKDLLDEAKGAAAAFKAMGLSIEDLRKPTDEVLLTVADKFAGYEDGAKKSALATEIFGKAGQDLIPFLNKGRAGIEELTAEARKLGIVMGDEALKSAAEFNDNLTRLESTAKAAGRAIAGPLVEALNTFSKELIEGRKQFGGFWEALVQLGLKTSPFDTYAESAKKSRAEVERLEKQIQQLQSGGRQITENGGGAAFLGPRNGVGNQQRLAAAQQRLEQERKRLAYFDTLASAGIDEEAKRLENAFYGGGGKSAAPSIPGSGSKDKEKVSEAARYLENLQKQLEKTQDLTALEQALNDIQKGRLDGLNPKLREQIEMTAKLIDQQKEEAKVREEKRQAVIAEGEAVLKQGERLQDLLAQGPAAKLEKQRETMKFLADQLERGAINAEQFNDAASGFLDLNRQAEKTKSLGEELGLTFTSAFEDAIVNGKKFSDVLKGLAADIARIVLRKQVTEPLGEAISGAFGGSGGGGNALGSIARSLFGAFSGAAQGAFSGTAAGASGFGTGLAYGNMDFGGFLAGGGDVVPGKAYIVGEKRPELFVPRTAGAIVPQVPTETGAAVVQNLYFTVGDVATMKQVKSEVSRAQAQSIAAAHRAGSYGGRRN